MPGPIKISNPNKHTFQKKVLNYPLLQWSAEVVANKVESKKSSLS